MPLFKNKSHTFWNTIKAPCLCYVKKLPPSLSIQSPPQHGPTGLSGLPAYSLYALWLSPPVYLSVIHLLNKYFWVPIMYHTKCQKLYVVSSWSLLFNPSLRLFAPIQNTHVFTKHWTPAYLKTCCKCPSFLLIFSDFCSLLPPPLDRSPLASDSRVPYTSLWKCIPHHLTYLFSYLFLLPPTHFSKSSLRVGSIMVINSTPLSAQSSTLPTCRCCKKLC